MRKENCFCRVELTCKLDKLLFFWVKRGTELNDQEEGSQEDWAKQVGERLGLVLQKLGKEVAATVTDRTWRQLLRYTKGFEPPIGILKRLSDESGVSMIWLCDGVMAVGEDAEMEIAAIERELREVNRGLMSDKEVDRLALADRQGATIGELDRLHNIRDDLRRRWQEPSVVGAPSILDYYSRDAGEGAIYVTSPETLGPAAEVDLALLEDLMVALDDVLLELNRQVSFETKAKLIAEVYAKAVAAKEAGRMSGLTGDIIRLVKRSD